MAMPHANREETPSDGGEVSGRFPASSSPGGSASARYAEYARPAVQKLLALLKLDVAYVRAKGEHLFFREGNGEVPVVDMLGGFGSTILGHHPPELTSLVHELLDAGIPIHAQGSIRSHAALLGEALDATLRRTSPGHLTEGYVTHLVNTGTDAVESAIKHAHLEWLDRRAQLAVSLRRRGQDSAADALENVRPCLVAIDGSFHGKTAGSLAVTAKPHFGAMYPQRVHDTRFLPRDLAPEDVRPALDAESLALPADVTGIPASFSRIAGVIVEVVQGEGGVVALPEEFVRALARECKALGVPLIADEIQTGMYRTGTFLAAHAVGIDPDYVTLGKSLGGGMVKIAALLVRRSRYEETFGLLDTSTYAEDDLSSCVARRTLEILDADRELPQRAASFERRVRAELARLTEEFPGVITDVRGKGFLIGIEFSTRSDRGAFADEVASLGLTTYLFASYLLHRHRVRVGPTLGQDRTLRLEPCATISDAAVTRVLAGIRDLVEKLHADRWSALTAHLWNGDLESPDVSTPRPVVRQKPDVRKVTFLTHLISTEALAHFDPAFVNMPAAMRRTMIDTLWPRMRSVIIHEQEIEGRDGGRIHFELRGFMAPTQSFKASLRRGDSIAQRKVAEAVLESAHAGATHIGLGQFTSIVTHNGLTAGRPNSARLTTGNSLTVGMTYRALQRLLAERGQRLSEMHVGIVGAAGNICSVFAQILADEARKLTVVHRESAALSRKFQRAIETILANSKLSAADLRASASAADLVDCDLVVIATNSVRTFILPEHLKRDAVVIDMSVPINVDASVFSTRPDVRCFLGGYAQLPFGQRLTHPAVPVPPGQLFTCMAETIAMGLVNYSSDLSFGELSKRTVLESLRIAELGGIELGALVTPDNAVILESDR